MLATALNGVDLKSAKPATPIAKIPSTVATAIGSQRLRVLRALFVLARLSSCSNMISVRAILLPSLWEGLGAGLFYACVA